MRTLHRLAGFLAWTTIAVLACAGGESGPADPPGEEAPDAPDEAVDAQADVEAETVAPPYPLDDTLRVNHIQAKGTHNSYHVATPGAIPEWSYTHAPLADQLDGQGVRQVELDVHWSAAGFTVHHVPYGDPGTTCETLKGCLGILKDWSDGHAGHHLLFVLIEPKDDIDEEKITGHYDELDAEILSVWPRERVLAPDDVRGARASLREAVGKDGWPTLGATRGKAMFAMLDSSAHRDAYLAGHPNLEGRVMFARNGEGEPWCVFLEYGNPVASEDEIRQRVQEGYVVRTFAGDWGDSAADSQTAADAALRSGAQVISTDYPSADEGPGGWSLVIPEGTPSRCDPVTAPAECTPSDIESLNH